MTETVFKGDIAGFPPEVVELMLQRQVEQGKEKNIEVFEISRTSVVDGFDWSNTPEGYEFWESVLRQKNFGVFFNKYPRTENLEIVVLSKPRFKAIAESGNSPLNINKEKYPLKTKYTRSYTMPDDTRIVVTPKGDLFIEPLNYMLASKYIEKPEYSFYKEYESPTGWKYTVSREYITGYKEENKIRKNFYLKKAGEVKIPFYPSDWEEDREFIKNMMTHVVCSNPYTGVYKELPLHIRRKMWMCSEEVVAENNENPLDCGFPIEYTTEGKEYWEKVLRGI